MLSLPRKKAIIAALSIFLLLVICSFSCLAYLLVFPIEKAGEDQLFFICEGASVSQVAKDLENKKIIRDKNAFLLWSRFKGYADKIKAGEYLLSPRMSSVHILEMLRKGSVLTHAVTIPEGFSRMQIAALLEQKGLADKDKFLKITGDSNVARGYGISGPDLEGYLYPDTYHFSKGLSETKIADVMVKHFQEIIEPFKEKIEQSNMSTEEVVVLASIVEKETGCAEERPLIASVFLNRLKKRFRLESDPTVIYGIKNFDGNLRKKDLSRHSEYNTYVIRGLPPGAIANPGQESIRAVLYPAKTSYLYFVSKNDGRHYFSKTLSEHNRAVVKYQKNKKYRRNPVN